MNEPKRKPSPEKDWKDQIMDIVGAFEPDDESWGVFHLTDETKPFILNAVREVIRACYSQVHVEKEMTLTPYRVGAMVGHKWDIVRNVGKHVIPSQHVPPPKNPAEQKIHDKVRDFIAGIEKSINDSREPTRRAVTEALYIALDQETGETRQFLDGFTKALNAGTLTKTGKMVGANSRTFLCLLVLEFGPTLENRFKTVNEFHAWVDKNLGRNIAGSLERFQKFCNQIQLHFKAPGRLKKQNRK